jgi:hypothetical protein
MGFTTTATLNLVKQWHTTRVKYTNKQIEADKEKQPFFY